MCVIAAKNQGVAFPSNDILKNCWDNNPNMGGFMYTLNNEVHIKKGYKTWESFINALNETRKQTGDDIPYVMHFRISTQGYSTDCCQPFPLSGKMKNLKRQKSTCSIGVAHNGIIDFTSDGAKDYSDTMKFITDILVNIIRGFDWYQEPRNVRLIENLIDGSRLAILDKFGHIELLGNTWVKDEGGVYYSNSTYSYKKVSYSFYGGVYDYDDYYTRDWWEDYYSRMRTQGKKDAPLFEESKGIKVNAKKEEDPFEDFKDENLDKYLFDEDYCPYSLDGDCSYCNKCMAEQDCYYMNETYYKAVGETEF